MRHGDEKAGVSAQVPRAGAPLHPQSPLSPQPQLRRFFALLLTVIGLVFRPALEQIVFDQVDDALDEEWGAAKGYLHYFKTGWGWFYDAYDPEEGLIVSRVQHVFMLADDTGKPIDNGDVGVSDIYRSIGVESPAEIRQRLQRLLRTGKAEYEVRYDRHDHNMPYRIRSGVLRDKEERVYYMAVGRSITLETNVLHRFSLVYFAMLPVLIAVSSIFGWFMAGRALTPLASVAATAQRVSGSSLNVRIPSRGAGDELDHLIRTFNRMMDRLATSFEKIRQFSTDVSHELRTPLTVIRGQLEVALFTAKTEEQYRDAMVNALEDVERLSQIVRALLLLSQSETGQLVLQKTRLDLAHITRDLVEEFRVSAEEKHIQLTADLPEQCVAQADRIQIERLVSNLLSNALKYTPEGGEVRVSLARVFESGRSVVRLVVQDTGVGIPTEHLPHIFDRFYKVPSTDPEKGLGLGLSFVAWIVKAHGGTIDVESHVNGGTKFTVLLPDDAPGDGALEEPSAAAATASREA